MNEMKELFTEAWKEAKADPVEAILSAVLLTGMFAFFYAAIWIVCPC